MITARISHTLSLLRPSDRAGVEPGNSAGTREAALLLEDEPAFGTRQTYDAGTLLFSPGQHADGMYLVLSGAIRVYALSFEGRELMYWYCHRGDFVGMAEIWSGTLRRCFASAREPSVVKYLASEELDGIFASHPTVGSAMLAQLSVRLRAARDSMLAIVTFSARARLARLLTMLPRAERGDDVRLAGRYTQQELANLAGLSRQTTSELLNDFRRDRWITTRDGRIVLLAAQALTEVAEHGV
ncbi:MAG: Crp/Fnr family transcriptional regulator [Vulcanimicrobiaceae bacterium]